jgi:hypothetical protein
VLIAPGLHETVVNVLSLEGAITWTITVVGVVVAPRGVAVTWMLTSPGAIPAIDIVNMLDPDGVTLVGLNESHEKTCETGGTGTQDSVID